MTIIEKKLKESEEKFRTLTEQSFLGITILQDDIIQYVNNQLAKIFGYTVEEIMAWEKGGFLNVIYPEDRKLVAEQAKKKQTGESDNIKQYQFRGIKKNKDIVWLEIFSKSINYKGKPADFATIHDITDKKISEQKLRESEEKYRSIFNNMTEGFAYHEVIVDENNNPIDYKYLEVNPAFERLTGLKAEQMIGKKVTEVLPGTENDPADWIGRFGNVGLTGIPLVVEDYSEAIDKWFKVSGYSPQKGYFAVTFSDITEQKKAEIFIAESEEKYRNLFNNAPFAIILLNINGTILDCNMSSNLITGYSKEELIGKNFRDFNFYVDVKSAKIEEREKKIKGGGIPDTRDILLYNKDGSQFWARTNIEFVHMKDKTYLQAIIQDVSEQKESQIKLEESESKFRTIFEAIPDLYFLVSGEATILDYRGKEQELYLSPEEFLGKKVIDVLPTNLAKNIIEFLKKTLMTQQSQSLEYELEVRGKLQFYEARFFYMSKDKASIFIRDITERKNIEKQISDLAKFPSENPNPVLRVKNKKIRYINKAGRDLFHLNEGNKISSLLEKEIVKALDENTTKILEVEFGDKIYMFDISPIMQEGYANIYGRDITERKKSEIALNLEKKFADDILNSSMDTVFVFNPESGKAVRWNNVFQKVCGYSNEEISSMKAPESYYNVKDLERASEAIKNVLEKGRFKVEMSLITKEDRSILYEYTVTTLEDSSGDTLIVSVGRDISERKIAEEVLKLSEKKYKDAYDRGNFYKDLFAHDINNILQVINSSAELITYQLGESEKSKEIENISSIIRKQVSRGAKLISNVRTLSELEEKEIITRKIEIGNVLKNSIVFVEKAYEGRNVNISLSSIEGDYFTNANELLQDVFENVLINGIKYNEHSNIEILIKSSKHKIDTKNYFKIEFIDNGIGVSDERKEVIFSSGNRELKGSKGMGLGLSLVSKILTIFKGEIWVEDKIEGDYTKGSNFIILLPET